MFALQTFGVCFTMYGGIFAAVWAIRRWGRRAAMRRDVRRDIRALGHPAAMAELSRPRLNAGEGQPPMLLQPWEGRA